MCRKFLIIRFSSIGDIIQCMGVIGGIKNRFPEAEIHWITRKDMSTFLAMDKRIDKIWGFDKNKGIKGLWEIAGELRKEKYDYIYDAHSNIRSNILKLKLRRVGKYKPKFALRSKERFKRLLLFKCRINKFPIPFKGMESFQAPLHKWGITDFKDNYSDWYFPEEYKTRWQPLIETQTITLVPSANWPMKRWPLTHWQTLVTLLPEFNFIILAGPEDIFCEEIKQMAPERVNNLAGKTNLLESCYIINQSKFVVSADTGFMHAADLFGVKTIALMGPTAFGFPTGKSVKIMETCLSCRPCTKDGRGKCKQVIYQKCLVDIMPETVAANIRKMSK